jgi:hypothetical protein
MLSRMQNKIGTAGLVVAIVALVAALGGGAYAASNDSGDTTKASASAKGKKGPRGPRGKTGKPGPVGPQGPAGPAGAAGAKGDKGDKGDAGNTGNTGPAGADGKSVKSSAASVGECPDGGTKFTIETTPVQTSKACNGEDGETGYTDVLPPGKAEYGHWGVALTGAGLATSPISFNIPYPGTTGPTLHFVTFAKAEAEEVPAECSDGTTEGSVDGPIADPGHLCVFEELPSFAPLAYEEGTTNGFGTDPWGVTLFFSGAEFSAGTGTWVVRAPTA